MNDTGIVALYRPFIDAIKNSTERSDRIQNAIVFLDFLVNNDAYLSYPKLHFTILKKVLDFTEDSPEHFSRYIPLFFPSGVPRTCEGALYYIASNLDDKRPDRIASFISEYIRDGLPTEIVRRFVSYARNPIERQNWELLCPIIDQVNNIYTDETLSLDARFCRLRRLLNDVRGRGEGQAVDDVDDLISYRLSKLEAAIRRGVRRYYSYDALP